MPHPPFPVPFLHPKLTCLTEFPSPIHQVPLPHPFLKSLPKSTVHTNLSPMTLLESISVYLPLPYTSPTLEGSLEQQKAHKPLNFLAQQGSEMGKRLQQSVRIGEKSKCKASGTRSPLPRSFSCSGCDWRLVRSKAQAEETNSLPAMGSYRLVT
uniref:Uncharacterized protein n=1 Tax=Myotis myotis TaxID=51298 RepID=A0A7J7XHS7_MYOMY|nr:hypothetical protein mMyoMyo1_011792 [Myotis myotis]